MIGAGAIVASPKHMRTGERIVAVEDEPDFRAILHRWLDPHYELILLRHGQGLIDEIALLQPDAVLLDVGLPGPDGVALCRQLRAQPEVASVPVIFVSGMGDEATIARALEAGASAFLAKPLEFAELQAKLQALFNDRKNV